MTCFHNARISHGLTITAVSALFVTCPALACGGFFDVACNVGSTIEKAVQDTGKTIEKGAQDAGRTIEKGAQDTGKTIDKAGRDIDRMRLELQSSIFTGPALEQWFIASRNTAMTGAMPMPIGIRQALQGWYDPNLMNLVRYKIGDGGALNLANNSIQVGSAEAVTLIDVIVFRGPEQAADAALWAHEMKHIEQFNAWGVHSFSVQYMRSWNGVEDPAYAVQAEYSNTHQTSQQNIQQVAAPSIYSQPVSQQTAQACVIGPGPYGWCQLSSGVPLGISCYCDTPYGQRFFGMSQ